MHSLESSRALAPRALQYTYKMDSKQWEEVAVGWFGILLVSISQSTMNNSASGMRRPTLGDTMTVVKVATIDAKRGWAAIMVVGWARASFYITLIKSPDPQSF
jgi:hypothetical protein